MLFRSVDTEARSADGVVGGTDDAAAADVGIGRDGHVFKDLFFVPDVVAGGDDVGAEIEEFFSDGRCDAEAAGCIFAVDDEEIDGVGLEDVGQMFTNDMAAGGAEDVTDEEDIHCEILHGCDIRKRRGNVGLRRGCGSFLAWHRASVFN